MVLQKVELPGDRKSITAKSFGFFFLYWVAENTYFALDSTVFSQMHLENIKREEFVLKPQVSWMDWVGSLIPWTTWGIYTNIRGDVIVQKDLRFFFLKRQLRGLINALHNCY